jgi:outer membrane protein W
MLHSFPFKTLLICLVQLGSVFFVSSAQAQNTTELGIGIGGLNYRGDLSPEYQFENNRPALTVFYRKDISVPITLRGALTGGMLQANDDNVQGVNDATAPLHMKGGLAELSAVLEYNFFDFHNRRDKIHFSPYVFIGVAGFYANTKTDFNNAAISNLNTKGGMLGVAIPVGLGLKYALSPRWNLGAEAGARKTFTDNLDHLGDQNALIANRHTKDWYFYNGVSISYTFYKIYCPD